MPQLDKPDFTRCAHQCRAGCGIYEARPQVCREWNCAWLQGAGDKGDRPDRSGVVLFTHKGPHGAPMVGAWVLRDTRRGRALLRRYARQVVVFAMTATGQRVTGPDEQVRAFRAASAAEGNWPSSMRVA